MATIENWGMDRGHEISRTQLFEGGRLPETDEFDWLVIMGGPMNIYEHDRYPWLIKEKQFIRRAIAKDKIVLGICLGAQLIADVLGGKVGRNDHREIGWHPVTLTSKASCSEVFGVLPEKFLAFHWHSDTFEIPTCAEKMAKSEGCPNQAFQKGKVIGLQFHMESSVDSIGRLIRNCSDELVAGEYVQMGDEILTQTWQVDEMNRMMFRFLDEIEKRYGV